MYTVQDGCSDAELLKKIALDSMDKNFQTEYSLSQDIIFNVYSGAKWQLKFMGEDIEEVIDAYDLNISKWGN